MTNRLDSMRAMAARQPNNPLVRFGLANELLKGNLLEDAVVELSAYIASYDDEGNGWLRYADALAALGRHDEARAACHKGMDAAARYGHGSMVQEFEERLR
jgi:predicted Zn-dependent protease